MGRYEYWPWWLFFLPIFPVYLFYALRLRNFVYFTSANPGIEFGGFFGEKKSEILRELPEEYIAKSQYFEDTEPHKVLDSLRSRDFAFPIVFKPDVGERGEEVKILQTEENLSQHLETISYPYIIQEYIDFPIELGVFYSRLPNAREGQILSIVEKRFLEVEGDGERDVEELIASSDRGFLQLKRLKKEREELLRQIPANGVSLRVEPIGNHCLGTEFINAKHLISHNLSKVFDDISIPFKGFYYGRYDLKVMSYDDLYAGKSIKVFELNGVTSEPGHIYDKRMNIFKAYRDLVRQQRVVFQISQQNLRIHGHTTTLSEILKRAYQHFFLAKR